VLTASVKVPPEKFQSSNQQQEESQGVPTEPKKIILNSSDELYADLRDKNFNAVGSIVSKKAKVITAEFDVSWLFDKTVFTWNLLCFDIGKDYI